MRCPKCRRSRFSETHGLLRTDELFTVRSGRRGLRVRRTGYLSRLMIGCPLCSRQLFLSSRDRAALLRTLGVDTAVFDRGPIGHQLRAAITDGVHESLGVLLRPARRGQPRLRPSTRNVYDFLTEATHNVVERLRELAATERSVQVREKALWAPPDAALTRRRPATKS